jgi:hypothetical protein
MMVVFGSETPTSLAYAVERGGPPLWAQGEPIDRIIGDGDGLVPADSANLGMLVPEIPAQNVVKLTGRGALPITYHLDLQMQYLPMFPHRHRRQRQPGLPPRNISIPAEHRDRGRFAFWPSVPSI